MAEGLKPTRLSDSDPWSVINEARTQRGCIVAGWLMLALAFLATARFRPRIANEPGPQRQA